MAEISPVGHWVHVPYSEAEWVWVSNHYDIHLDGLCRYQGELCRFETWDADEDNPQVRIFRMTALEKLSWLLRKRMFELCIGHHWTYQQKKTRTHFYYRWPRWFYKGLFWAYYGFKRRWPWK